VVEANAHRVTLREVTENDIDVFFEHQLDREATEMAAFPSRDKEAHSAHWRKVLANDSNVTRAIVVDGQVAGNIGSWQQDGERLVGYWIGKSFWGRGIATSALRQFLDVIETRPLYAHVIRHNKGSIRVLEKGGFTLSDQPGDEPDELVMVLQG
jgi:RimJ/RimL family protein N-acetyltransferase